MDIGTELDRFSQETGVDFLRLVNDKSYRVRTIIDGIDNQDTDADENMNQHLYGELSQKNTHISEPVR